VRATTTDPATGAKRVEDRVNCSTRIVSERTHKPAPLPVETLPDGRSWCGCFHMAQRQRVDVFVVRPYPGWVDPQANARGRDEPSWTCSHYVKVIRAPPAPTAEAVALRLAFRNFFGGGHELPPAAPEPLRVPASAARTYLTPRLDRLEPRSSACSAARGRSATDWVPANSAVPRGARHAPAGTRPNHHSS